MKLKAIKRFNDRITHKRVDDKEIFEVSAERGKELIDKGVAIEVKPVKKTDNEDE